MSLHCNRVTPCDLHVPKRTSCHRVPCLPLRIHGRPTCYLLRRPTEEKGLGILLAVLGQMKGNLGATIRRKCHPSTIDFSSVSVSKILTRFQVIHLPAKSSLFTGLRTVLMDSIQPTGHCNRYPVIICFILRVRFPKLIPRNQTHLRRIPFESWMPPLKPWLNPPFQLSLLQVLNIWLPGRRQASHSKRYGKHSNLRPNHHLLEQQLLLRLWNK